MYKKNEIEENIELDVSEAFIDRFGSIEGYHEAKKIYENSKSFAANDNVFDTEDGKNWDDKVHFIMRWTTGNYIKKAFEAMKIDLSDPNISQNLSEGNIGTFQRIAKVWCGFDTHDDKELGGGRWSKRPRLASFPNNGNKNIPITKRVDIVSNCSHHFITFSSVARPDSYAIISYIPDKFVLGISKLQRVADWISQRFFLQEDLTKMLYDEVKSAAKTDSVYVGLFNMVHGCESFRGAKSSDGAFTSEYYGGAFEDVNIREAVKK